MKKRKIVSMISIVLASVMLGNVVLAAPDVNEIKEQKKEAAKEVNSLQAELTKVISEINELEEELIKTGEQIIDATEDLEAAEIKEKEQYAAMKLRIKYMYEEGDTSAFEKLIGAGTIGELLSQAEYIQSVHTYDRQQLKVYAETKNEIKDLKKTLEKEQRELEADQKSFTDKKVKLDKTLEEKRKEVKNLDEQLEAAIEAAAKEAAERAAREQAEREAKEKAEREAREKAEREAKEKAEREKAEKEKAEKEKEEKEKNDKEDKKEEEKKEETDNSINTGSSRAKKIVNAAYSQLGTPYRWGGTTPYKGLDCSGLTQYCHRQAGISIARTSGSQGAGGKRVSNPQPGDVVCYSGHVGIYIGNNKMIHAPQPGEVVRIQKIYGSPWFRRYW